MVTVFVLDFTVLDASTDDALLKLKAVRVFAGADNA